MAPESQLNISGSTKLTALIGSPVGHSLSPAMHNASYAKLGINAVYAAFDVKNYQLESVVRAFPDMGMIGYNVAMPCKTTVCKYLDALSPAAELMGAVNCVQIVDGRSIGHNTDGEGFVANLRSLDFDPEDKIVTIAGTGGAGLAVFTQLALEGVKRIDVYNRSDRFHGSGISRVEMLSEQTGVPIVLRNLGNRGALSASIAESDLFINATRAGMTPLDALCVIDESMLHDDLVVADTVYYPRETKLIRMAKEHGLKTAPGYGMLLHQAALSEKVWFGPDTEMPIDYIAERFF